MRTGYIGANGVARKVTKVYIGVSGTARKVTKGYVGIGGLARKWWPEAAGELEKVEGVTALSVARNSLAATSIGNYALFAGGNNNGGVSAVVDAYQAV